MDKFQQAKEKKISIWCIWNIDEAKCRLTFQPIGIARSECEISPTKIEAQNRKWNFFLEKSIIVICQKRSWICGAYIKEFSILFIIRRVNPSEWAEWKTFFWLKTLPWKGQQKKMFMLEIEPSIFYHKSVGNGQKWHVNWFLFTKFSTFPK